VAMLTAVNQSAFHLQPSVLGAKDEPTSEVRRFSWLCRPGQTRQLDAEPAKNPSFWTKNSKIEVAYMKVGDFWLPERNYSVTAIRFGGRAELTIQYENYQITSADPVGNLPSLKSDR